MIGECIEPISFNNGDGDLEVVYNDKQKNKEHDVEETDMCYDSDPGVGSIPLLDFGKDGVFERRDCLHERSKSVPLFKVEGRNVPFKDPRGMYFDSIFEDDEEDDNGFHEHYCRTKSELCHSSPVHTVDCHPPEFMEQALDNDGDISDEFEEGLGYVGENESGSASQVLSLVY